MGKTSAEEAFLRGVTGSAHWSEADARRVLAMWEASGDSRAAFARRHGLRATRLAWWSSRLAAWAEPDVAHATSTDPVPGAFVQLMGTRVETTSTWSSATVRVGPVVVELATLDAAGAGFIAALARALGADACS